MKRLKQFTAFFMLVCFLTCGPAAQTAGVGWGLAYSEPGEKPVGNLSPEQLLKYDAYFVGSGDEKTLYLTFDAGFENGHTDEILDILERQEVSAAFFIVGSYVKNNPDLIRRMESEGHIVANHTMGHHDMSQISDESTFLEQLTRTEDIYREVTGKEMPRYYRPPEGKYSEANLKMAKKFEYKTIFWSTAYVDWLENKQPSKDTAFGTLLPRIHPGAVLLLHSTSDTNTKILEELISRCKDMGYEFKGLDYLTADGGQ